MITTVRNRTDTRKKAGPPMQSLGFGLGIIPWNSTEDFSNADGVRDTFFLLGLHVPDAYLVFSVKTDNPAAPQGVFLT